LAWWSLLFSLPLTVGFVLISHERLYTSFDFVIPGGIASVLSCFGGVLLFRAYKYADASVVCPLTNLLPIAMVPTTFIFTGQLPAPLGFVGILLVVAGVYYSSVSGKHSLSHPFGQIYEEQGLASDDRLGDHYLSGGITGVPGDALGFSIISSTDDADSIVRVDVRLFAGSAAAQASATR